MKIHYAVWATVVVLTAVSTARADPSVCIGEGRISREIVKPMIEAQRAMKAHQWRESLGWLDEVDRTAGVRSPFDRYHIGEMRGYVYEQLKLRPEAAQELESGLLSPCLPAEKKLGRLRLLSNLNYSLRNYPKAIEYGSSAATISPDAETLFLVAVAHYQLGEFQSAARRMQEAIASESRPTETHLLGLKAFCKKADDQACVKSALAKLDVMYPNPKYSMALLKVSNDQVSGESGWKSLFNGKNLDGWTPKIAKHPVGENFADTFRVEDGVIKVSYDKYGKFDRQFGHLFSNQAYSNYILQLEYKFVGAAIEDSPPWAKLNSGLMIHSQSPLSMSLGQEFPASMEFQFLATGATAGKQTGNVCTPATNLEMNGKLLLDHIIDAKSKFYPLDQWVSVEAEVHGNKEVIYRVNGAEVLRFQRPQLDPRDTDAQRLLAAGAPLQLSFGHIALQAESQPVWFRNIRIKQLDE